MIQVEMLKYTESPRKSVHRKSSVKPQLKSFQEAIGPVLAFGQCFGSMPVEGILSKDIGNLKFRWKSLRTIYSIVFLICGTIESCLAIRRLLRLGFNLHFAEAMIFFISSMARCFALFQMARKWEMIMKYWKKCENVFLHSPYQDLKGWSLARKIRISTVLLVLLLFVEHSLFLATSINDNYNQLTYCNDAEHEIFWKNFLARNRPHLLYHFPYSPWELPLYEWVNFLTAFSWNYGDIFIIIVSIGITYRFDQFNNRLESICDKYLDKPFWQDLRTDYVKLCDLVQFVDSHISTLILIATSHNLFVLIIKIFNGLKPTRWDAISEVYFWFYLSFLALRTGFMLYAASSINESSRMSLRYIRRFPSRNWCVDLKRLTDTIQSETIALSGKRFFFMTKGLILAMAGTILTYELVLLDEVKPEIQTLCSSSSY